MRKQRLPALSFGRLPLSEAGSGPAPRLPLLPALLIALAMVTLLAGCAVAPGLQAGPEFQAADPGALLPGSVFRDCADCPEMVVVPPGRFVMGSPDSDMESWSAEREGPPHEVSIPRAFAVGRTEITRAQYAAFVAASGREGSPAGGCFHWTGAAWENNPVLDWRNPGFAQQEDEPVVCVAWRDAQAYVEWLAAKTGRPYRLLSEAEWEYAARAGTTTTRFWGDKVDAGCAYANLGDRSMYRELNITPFADCNDGYARTAPAGRFLPNAFGLYDMLGNVWEWTADCWREGYAGASADGTAWTAEPCARRTNRGAGWNSHPRNVRSSNRGSYAPVPYESVGIRVAR